MPEIVPINVAEGDYSVSEEAAEWLFQHANEVTNVLNAEEQLAVFTLIPVEEHGNIKSVAWTNPDVGDIALEKEGNTYSLILDVIDDDAQHLIVNLLQGLVTAPPGHAGGRRRRKTRKTRKTRGRRRY